MGDKDEYNSLYELFKAVGITEEDLQNISDPLSDRRVDLIRDIADKLSDNIGEGFDVMYGIDNPFPGVGFVRMIGDVITIKNTKLFADACCLSGDIDMFLEDGKPVIELTIHGKESI